MSNQLMLSTSEKKRQLTKLIEHAKKYKFNEALIKDYEIQLSEVEKEIKGVSEKRKQFNLSVIERGLN